MRQIANSLFRRLLGDEQGGIAAIVAIVLPVLVGVSALSVDAGYIYYAQRALQASTDAAALAGAQVIGTGGSAISAVTSYGATGTLNAKANLANVTATTTFKCYTSIGLSCSTNQTPSCSTASSNCAGTSGANGVEVVQTAEVPTFFARIFGVSSVKIAATASASARGGVATPLNVALILDTTASMGSAPSGSTALAACSGYTKSAIACAAHGAQTLLDELWPCASGLGSCGSSTPVDEVALFTFPPVTNSSEATTDIGCTNPQIATTYSGVEGIAENSTSTTLNLLPSSASVTGSISGKVLTVTSVTSGAVALGGTVKAGGSSYGTISTFGTGVGGDGTYNLSASYTVSSKALTISYSTWGMQPSSGSANMSTTNAFNTTPTWSAVVTDTTNAVLGSGTWPWWGSGTTISSVSTSPVPGSATLSASPTGKGVVAGDEVYAAPLYQIVGFGNDYRSSDTAALDTTSNIVKITGNTKGTPCLGTPGGLHTYYGDAISAAQEALVTEQAARVAGGGLGGQNVIVLLTDGSASSTSPQMGPLLAAKATYECGAAVLASQAAAKAGTKVYAIFYDDASYTCNDTATAPGLSSTITSSCTAMQSIANSPGTTSGTYVNDPTKFYSIDGTSSPCPSINDYSTISEIFQNIAASLETARLISNNTT